MESIPVIVRRRDTGTLVQRLVFPAGGKLAGAAAARGGGGAAIAEAGAVTFNLDHLGCRGGDAARRLGPRRAGAGRPRDPGPRGAR